LNCKRDHPLLGVGRKIAIDSVRKPEPNDSANLAGFELAMSLLRYVQHDFEKSNKSAPNSWWGNFSNVNWDNETSGADSPTSDETSSINSTKMSKGEELNNRSDFKNDGAHHERKSSTDFFAKREDHKGTEETSSLKARDDVC